MRDIIVLILFMIADVSFLVLAAVSYLEGEHLLGNSYLAVTFLMILIETLSRKLNQHKSQREFFLEEEVNRLKAEGSFWKHTAAKWMPGKEGKQLRLEGWGKNYPGINPGLREGSPSF